MDPLTQIQRDYLVYIHNCIMEGWAPSLRELGERFGGVTIGTVQTHLEYLEKKGVLGREHGKPRLYHVLVTAKDLRALAVEDLGGPPPRYSYLPVGAPIDPSLPLVREAVRAILDRTPYQGYDGRCSHCSLLSQHEPTCPIFILESFASEGADGPQKEENAA